LLQCALGPDYSFATAVCSKVDHDTKNTYSTYSGEQGAARGESSSEEVELMYEELGLRFEGSDR
jgi:hypothetical protein